MALQDIDVFGTVNANGTIREYVDDNALGNAIISFLMSKKGDYVNDPLEGGIINEALFKNISGSMIEKLKFSIENSLKLRFPNLITLNKVSIDPDYQTRITTISIFYTSLLSNELGSATVYVNDTTKLDTFTYTEIDFTGDNLLTFVEIKKDTMLGKKLIYNLDELCWIWGETFKFINFSNTDPQFDAILSFCNL